MAEIIIQNNVPICPKCGAVLIHRLEVMSYKCFDCKARYRILDHGNTEREYVCEEIEQ